jgi:hypothetical protein
MSEFMDKHNREVELKSKLDEKLQVEEFTNQEIMED